MKRQGVTTTLGTSSVPEGKRRISHGRAVATLAHTLRRVVGAGAARRAAERGLVLVAPFPEAIVVEYAVGNRDDAAL